MSTNWLATLFVMFFGVHNLRRKRPTRPLRFLPIGARLTRTPRIISITERNFLERTSNLFQETLDTIKNGCILRIIQAVFPRG
jgi:hypothetical protein